ncbi:MAG TPA: hypothetical protein VFS23_17025 [Vicinamibacterales bacterium]|nr:hypothetical protein [Vicinamibacterales bacterium]
MAALHALFEEPIEIAPDYSDTSDKDMSPSDRHLVLLAAANAAIDRTLSRDPVTFLNRHKQARGE